MPRPHRSPMWAMFSWTLIFISLALYHCDSHRAVPGNVDSGMLDGWQANDGPRNKDGPVKKDGPKKKDGPVKKDGPKKKDGPIWPPDYHAVPDWKIWPPDKALKKDQGPKPCKPLNHACVSDKDCCGNFICSTAFNGARMCTIKCKPDDPKTPLVNEDNCPGSPNKSVCANIASPPAQTYRCLQRCVPTTGKNTCPVGLACRPKSVWMTQSVSISVCGFPACKGGKDCPVYLSKLCSPSSPMPQCVGFPAGTYCAPHYPGSFGGRCAMPGACDTVNGNCAPHKLGKASAKVGAPCIDDRNCGPQMECNMEVSTSGTVYYRNGYCSIEGCAFGSTLTDRKCPSGSTCSRIYYSGRCLKTCDLKIASSCRGYAKDKHGDYECRAWNLFPTGSPGPYAGAPVCEAGYAAPCTMFTGKLSCTNLGIANNYTDMACRQPGTGQKVPATSPYGTCLDNTASGK